MSRGKRVVVWRQTSLRGWPLWWTQEGQQGDPMVVVKNALGARCSSVRAPPGRLTGRRAIAQADGFLDVLDDGHCVCGSQWQCTLRASRPLVRWCCRRLRSSRKRL